MYRILTERKNLQKIKAVLRRLGLDYTLVNAEGSWQGQTESSIAIELDAITWRTTQQLAQLIKTMNDQQAVLIQTIPSSSRLI